MRDLTPLLTACPPRPLYQAGDQYAADLTRGLAEELATAAAAADFLETTHLTAAAQDFLRLAMRRVALGSAAVSPSVYQLYSRYGGGKTHSLLLLAAAAKYPDLPYWAAAAQCAAAPAQVIAFDGARHNVVNGALMDDQGHRARSLAGYLLYHLGGPPALRDFQDGDAALLDPAADAFQRLIGDAPVIIVIDELVQYISRVNQLAASGEPVSTEGVLTTLSALAAAAANSPRAVLVITTPEDAHELLEESAAAAPGDAYPADALALTAMLHRINSQTGRMIYPVAPSESADLPAILRKRLFYRVDETARRDAAETYAAIAARNGRANENLDYPGFYDAYPFHPALLNNIISGRLAANHNFQRVRGTLRLLGSALQEMQHNASSAALLHPYHLTPRVAALRSEIINRLGFMELDAAIDTDILGRNSTAEKTGSDLAEPAAVTMLLGSIAPESSSGLYSEQIADALLSPEHDDFGVIANALEQFLHRAIYVDDSPDTQRQRFSKDANVMKELLEARDALSANTARMDELLRQALTSAYGGGRQSDALELLIFPSRQSNVPDNPDRAVLGIVNPDHWNWSDAANPAQNMSNPDLLDLHRHSGGSDGAAPRQYPNNALLLAAHDANLARIREDIATMEAADRLLKDPSRPLPPHRRETLESLRAAAEKNATTGIQNKFTHLFSAGNDPQRQWPVSHSHLEHRHLQSLTDAVGKGQEGILQALGDRILRGPAAGLSKAAWEQVGIIANPQGSALGELRDYFARTPDRRIVVNAATWRAMIANGVSNNALHLRTPGGEVNPTTGYDPAWQVWVQGYEPAPEPPPEPERPSQPGPAAPPESLAPPGSAAAPARQTAFTSGKMPGKAAYEAVKRFMADNHYDWPALTSCRVQGTSPALADQIASIAQGQDQGIAITLLAQNSRVRVAIHNAPPGEFKDYAGPARRILNRAEIADADITVQLEPPAARRILENLNNRDEANISIAFDPEIAAAAAAPQRNPG